MSCPVCGHPTGSCTGDTRTNERQIITSEGVVKSSGPERVPRQRPGIGRAGYIGERTGKVQIYEPGAPNIRFVSVGDVEEIPGTVEEFDGEPVAGDQVGAFDDDTPPSRPPLSDPPRGDRPKGGGVPRRSRKKGDE